MEAKDLLEKIATPGDAAAAGLGFAAGLPIDYFLLGMGVPPGTVSAYSAVAVWSVKKTFESILKARRERREALAAERREALAAEGRAMLDAPSNGAPSKESLKFRYHNLEAYLDGAKKFRILEATRRVHELWRLQLLTNVAFEAAMDSALSQLMQEEEKRSQLAQSIEQMEIELARAEAELEFKRRESHLTLTRAIERAELDTQLAQVASGLRVREAQLEERDRREFARLRDNKREPDSSRSQVEGSSARGAEGVSETEILEPSHSRQTDGSKPGFGDTQIGIPVHISAVRASKES